MKMLICLHGNPLQGQEFEPLIAPLQAQGINPIIHKRLLKNCKLESLIQSINATAKVSGGGPFGIAAYSWGAYLAMAYLNRFPENVAGLVLVNPLLIDEKPLPNCLTTALKIPLFGTLALKMRSRKMAAAFIQKTFEPEIPSEEVGNQLKTYLSHAQVWRAGAAYKKLMLANPLSVQLTKSNTPIRVLFGEKDQSAPPAKQMAILSKLGNVNVKNIPTAGHALPWTHPNKVIEEIVKIFQ